MNTAKIYQDSEGNDCSIYHMVRKEPDWAANRVQEGEKAIERVAELETVLQMVRDNDVARFMRLGEYGNGDLVRAEIQRVLDV